MLMTTRVLVALCLLGAVGAATCATSSKLLFLDQATNTLLGKTLSGKTALEVKVAPQETTKVLPGAVSDDNKLAFNPANVRVNVTATAVPYVFVTDLKTKKAKKVKVPPVNPPTASAGLPYTSCNFANISQYESDFDGTYLAAGATSDKGRRLAYIQACPDGTYLVNAYYHNGKITQDGGGQYIQGLKPQAQDTRPFVQHNQTAHTLLISGKQTCVIATKKAGSAGVFEAVSAQKGFKQVGAASQAAFKAPPQGCRHFVLGGKPSRADLVAACYRARSGTFIPAQVIVRSESGSKDTSNSAKNVAPTAVPLSSLQDTTGSTGYNSLALGGSDSLYAVTVAPKGFLTTVRKITVVGKNKPLRTKALFKLPTGYGSVVHLR